MTQQDDRKFDAYIDKAIEDYIRHNKYQIARKVWEEFWVEKQEYPSDIKVEQFGDWLCRAFPDWLDEQGDIDVEDSE